MWTHNYVLKVIFLQALFHHSHPFKYHLSAGVSETFPLLSTTPKLSAFKISSLSKSTNECTYGEF